MVTRRWRPAALVMLAALAALTGPGADAAPRPASREPSPGWTAAR
jgi:hypothetical protein